MRNPFKTRQRRTVRPKDLICTRHRRRLQMIGAGSLMDLSGRATMTALARTRTDMTTCADCTAMHLDNTDTAR